MAQPPPLGFGLGLRPVYYHDILEKNPRVDWFEVISENFMVPGGRPLAIFERIRSTYPIVMHGVSMSIASTAPLDFEYLRALKGLADRFQPEWISDHLCWTGVHGVNLHDLLPIPYTSEALDHIVERIRRVQDFLGRRVAIENVSSYVTFANPKWTNGRSSARWRSAPIAGCCSTSTTSSFRVSIIASIGRVSSMPFRPIAWSSSILLDIRRRKLTRSIRMISRFAKKSGRSTMRPANASDPSRR